MIFVVYEVSLETFGLKRGLIFDEDQIVVNQTKIKDIFGDLF